jgi:hypothetical protein
MEKLEETVLDSTIALKDGVDSIPNLTPEEKKLAANGTIHINMDMKKDKFLTGISFPFTTPAQMEAYNKLSGKIITETLKSRAGGDKGANADEDNMPPLTFIDQFYKTDFSNGELTKKIDKDKYAKAEEDEFLKQVREGSAMGLVMNCKYIINLPRPAKKAEGKNVKLSEDKMKVLVSATLDDFFEDPSSLEFKIEY